MAIGHVVLGASEIHRHSSICPWRLSFVAMVCLNPRQLPARRAV